MFNNRQLGQSLLEVLTALGVAVVIIVALSILAVSGLRNAQHAKAKAIGTKLVSEGIEQVRVVRDHRGWSNFSLSTPGCYQVETASTPWSLVSVSCGGVAASGQFTREIRLENADTVEGEGRKITVTVYWTDAFGQNTSSATTILTAWR